MLPFPDLHDPIVTAIRQNRSAIETWPQSKKSPGSLPGRVNITLHEIMAVRVGIKRRSTSSLQSRLKLFDVLN